MASLRNADCFYIISIRDENDVSNVKFDAVSWYVTPCSFIYVHCQGTLKTEQRNSSETLVPNLPDYTASLLRITLLPYSYELKLELHKLQNGKQNLTGAIKIMSVQRKAFPRLNTTTAYRGAQVQLHVLASVADEVFRFTCRPLYSHGNNSL